MHSCVFIMRLIRSNIYCYDYAIAHEVAVHSARFRSSTQVVVYDAFRYVYKKDTYARIRLSGK